MIPADFPRLDSVFVVEYVCSSRCVTFGVRGGASVTTVRREFLVSCIRVTRCSGIVESVTSEDSRENERAFGAERGGDLSGFPP